MTDVLEMRLDLLKGALGKWRYLRAEVRHAGNHHPTLVVTCAKDMSQFMDRHIEREMEAWKRFLEYEAVRYVPDHTNAVSETKDGTAGNLVTRLAVGWEPDEGQVKMAIRIRFYNLTPARLLVVDGPAIEVKSHGLLVLDDEIYRNPTLYDLERSSKGLPIDCAIHVFSADDQDLES